MGCCTSEPVEKHSSFAYSTPSTGNGIETAKSPPIVPYVPPEFQGTPDGSMTDTDAILLASNYCKDSPFQWQDEVLIHIGSRPLKWNFLVKGVDTESSKTVPMVLTIVNVKDFPIPLTNSTTLDVFANLVCGMASPYILSCEDADYIKDRSLLVVIRKFCDKGSIKDLIYGKQNPKLTYNDKYLREGGGRPLRPKMIRTFGRHVLEALSALNAKGIVCDCLHSGNVLIDGSVARIVELELTMLGGSIDQELLELLMKLDLHRDGKACELDVMLFGLLLLEMATGSPHHKLSFISETDDQFCERQGLSGIEGEAVRDILCSIFVTCEATVDGLLRNPFFKEVELSSPSPRLKFQSVEKGLIKSAMAAASDRLRQVREELRRDVDQLDAERARIDKDAEEVAIMEDVIVKRRAKPSRRHSQGATAMDGGSGAASKSNSRLSKKMSRRQSSGGNIGNSAGGASASPTLVPLPDPVGTEEEVVSPMATESRNSSEANITPSDPIIPPQYQKLLNIGLGQEQVKHKMLADGFDPSSIGW